MDISETAQLGPFDQLNITNFIIRVPLLSIKLKTILYMSPNFSQFQDFKDIFRSRKLHK